MYNLIFSCSAVCAAVHAVFRRNAGEATGWLPVVLLPTAVNRIYFRPLCDGDKLAKNILPVAVWGKKILELAAILQVSVAEWLARLTAVWEDPGSNRTANDWVYHDSCCDMQPWARAVHFYCSAWVDSVFHSSWDVKWVPAYGLSNNNMAMVDVDGSSLPADSQPKLFSFIWKNTQNSFILICSKLYIHSNQQTITIHTELDSKATKPMS